MISDTLFKASYRCLFQMLSEDVGDGDHGSMACIPRFSQGTIKLLVKGRQVYFLVLNLP
jgi:nicotinate-nucleotide pyrophosphorylase